MTSDGGKIGGKPGGPGSMPTPSTPSSSGASAAETPTPAAPANSTPSADQFVKAERPALGVDVKDGAMATGLAEEGSAALLRLTRDNPSVARQLVATLSGQTAAAFSQLEQALAVARQLLEKLARESFSQEARARVAEALRRQRQKIQDLKRKVLMGYRRMALMQQVAGKVGDPRLDDEIDRLLSDHQRLSTDWAKRNHLLAVGPKLYGVDADTPEHLQRVVKARVRAAEDGVGELLHDVLPHSVLTELMARTIDGSARTAQISSTAAKRGEHGRSLRSYVLLSELVEALLGRDPADEN